MMARQIFTCEEVIYDEGSFDEPVDFYQHESQLRFQDNVVYIPHMLPPILIQEYVPVYINYQTYEPYLVNRNIVAYVPAYRLVTYIQYVPYYSSCQAPDSFSSSDQNQDDNSFPSSDSNDTGINQFSELSISSEVSYSSSDEFSETTDHGGRNAEQVRVDDDSGEDEDVGNGNDSSYDDDEDCATGAGDSNSSWFNVAEKYPIDENQASLEDDCDKKDNDSSHHDDEGCSMEAGDSNDVSKKSRPACPTEDNQPALDHDSDKKDDSRCHKDDEHDGSSLLDFDVTEKYHKVNVDENESFFDDSSGEKENDNSHNNEDNHDHQDEDPLGEVSDQKEPDSSRHEGEDGGPIITLADILASEEYWKVKREEYWQKRRSRDLYRSALEGEIRPRKQLPDVGTLPTIFEDLPYPVNHPYDAGEDTFIDEFFVLEPLEVKKSESSSSAVVPKKKRFRNTRKMFSRMFRCFKPKTLKESKPP